MFGVYSSSESDMEEEDEEEEEQQAGPSDLGGVPWKEAVEIHAKLKGDGDSGVGAAEGTQNGLGPRAHGQEDGEMEEEDVEEDEEEDEDDEDEEEESSDGKLTLTSRFLFDKKRLRVCFVLAVTLQRTSLATAINPLA